MIIVLVVLTAIPGQAANMAGTDLLLPAAARVGSWVTDLYVFNPGDESVELTIYWLVRNQANLSPAGTSYTVGPGATLVLEDILMEVLGLDNAGGAFRVVASGNVVVSSRIYNQRSGVTFGQGLEGVPRATAMASGESTDIAGLTHNDSFRTNLILLDASGSGSNVELSLRDVDGAEIASRTYLLDAFEPVLDPITELDGSVELDHGSLHAEVTSGAVVLLASKVDNDPGTGDPTTLAPWASPGGSIDGTYQIAIYDSSGYATGGFIRARNQNVVEINASYTNWDKGNPLDPDCLTTFLWGSPEVGVRPLADFEHGISFDQQYETGATMSWTLTLTVSRNQSLSGTIAAVGSGFTGNLIGCNGDFPPLSVLGGKFR
jgi:hypothetical protein